MGMNMLLWEFEKAVYGHKQAHLGLQGGGLCRPMDMNRLPCDVKDA